MTESNWCQEWRGWVCMGEAGQGREEGWCELMWCAMNFSRHTGLKQEEGLWETAQLWVLLVCTVFPFSTEQPGQTLLQCMWPAPSGLTDPGHLLSPEQLPVAQWMDKNLLLVYKYSTPVKPINVALRL